jgi:hypothetical protein
MASRSDKVNVDLDAEIVERIRCAVGASAESDAAVVERALNAFLLGRVLDVTQARSNLSEEEAERVAYGELRLEDVERLRQEMLTQLAPADTGPVTEPRRPVRGRIVHGDDET